MPRREVARRLPDVIASTFHITALSNLRRFDRLLGRGMLVNMMFLPRRSDPTIEL